MLKEQIPFQCSTKKFKNLLNFIMCDKESVISTGDA